MSLWMAALMVLSAALTSVVSPQFLLRLVEEEKASYATTASVVSAIPAPQETVPLKKRGAQFQAQHRYSFLRRIAQASQAAIVPDCFRFRTRLLQSRRSQYALPDNPPLLAAEVAPCSPRAPPFLLPLA